MTRRVIRPLASLAAALLLAGCMVGPDYRRPTAPVPAAFKEAPPAGWKLATPADALDKGAWWSIYGDPVLDRLERQIDISNQTLAQSAAAYRQALAEVQVARGGLFPVLSATPGVSRSSRALSGSGGSGGKSGAAAQTSYSLEGNASWDLDVWGRIRRTIQGNVAAAQASAADLANARLSAQAALASDYFDLRAADSLQVLLNDTLAQYQRSLDIARNQYEAGVATRADVITAQTQLLTTQAQAVAVGIARAQYEHAIAVLTGHPPAELTLAAGLLSATVPQVPLSLPATLLERRPDIAAAERGMAQQNALIGAALASYYPDISLTALFGYVGNPLGSLISAPNQVWSLGASATQILFNGGITSGQVGAARAAYDESVAAYRQTVLTAFQQVEDGLSDLRILEAQAQVEDTAVAAAQQAVQIALNEYQAGTQAYTSVVTAQTTALQDREAALSIRQSRLVDSVALIEALGGGWNARLPDTHDIDRAGSVLPFGLSADPPRSSSGGER
jgi:NodT family efflux transporter outer membrane factor (OMF) lipoprotein